MIKANLEQLRGGAVLAIVMNGHGAYQSVTVFVSYTKHESATLIPSHFGNVDIIYSWRCTYKMLDNKRSGFHTGNPLKSETFIVTDKEDALNQAKALFNRKGKVFLGKNSPYMTKKERKRHAELY